MNSYTPLVVSHPGETLSERLDELGMSSKEFALRTGKPEKTIIAVRKGDSSITPEMAIQFERVLQLPAQFWLKRQRQYDEYLAREANQKRLVAALDWARQFPYDSMAKQQWLPACRRIEDKAAALLAFFGFSDWQAWEHYYLRQELKVVFRISLASTKKPHAISAWLRQGELQAAQISAPPYSPKALKAALPQFRRIMLEQPADFFAELQKLALGVGVKVVHTPAIAQAPINGCTRWLNDVPLVQLTGRYKRNDIFWFTFFHELGHILLHGKKDIFLEAIEYGETDHAKEAEADHFAKSWTLPESQEAELLSLQPLREQDIPDLAKRFETHPAIIVGRLQHLQRVPYTFGRRFLVEVILD